MCFSLSWMLYQNHETETQFEHIVAMNQKILHIDFYMLIATCQHQMGVTSNVVRDFRLGGFSRLQIALY